MKTRTDQSNVKKTAHADMYRLFQDLRDSAAEIESFHQRLVAAGFRRQVLPALVDRQAFVLQRDNQRPELLAEIAPEEQALLDKHILPYPLVRMSTPVLRLLSAVIHDLPNIKYLRERIESGLPSAHERGNAGFDLLVPEPAMAFEGQRVAVSCGVVGVEWILIRPDEAFGMRETLIEVPPAESEFEIEVSCPPVSSRIQFIAVSVAGELIKKSFTLDTRSWADLEAGHA